MNVSKHKQITIALAATGVLIGQGACLSGRQFREAALPSLESGVNLILDGVVNGLFATIEVETPSSGDDTSTTGQ